MNTATVTPIHSNGMRELRALFNTLHQPYGQGDIVRFNLAYQRLYPTLSRTEKFQAESLVDAMLDNLQDEKLAPTIYGVV